MTTNSRKSFRLHKELDVTWSIPEQNIGGTGRISNISLEGMLFITDQLFVPDHKLIICFSVVQVPAFPSKGHLTWFNRESGEGEDHYRCGVKFLYETILSPAWAKWMEDNILKLADAQDSTILNRYLTAEG